jgi:RNase P subunit RPR2
MRWLCRIWGHEWVASDDATLLTCLRCGRQERAPIDPRGPGLPKPR